MKCKDCGTDGFKSVWDVRKHKEDAHGAPSRNGKASPARTAGSDGERPKRKYTRRAARDGETTPKRKYQRRAPRAATETPSEPVVDAEAKLLSDVINCFANAETDRAADFRVLEYVAQRFGPAAYEDEKEEEA